MQKSHTSFVCVFLISSFSTRTTGSQVLCCVIGGVGWIADHRARNIYWSLTTEFVCRTEPHVRGVGSPKSWRWTDRKTLCGCVWAYFASWGKSLPTWLERVAPFTRDQSAHFGIWYFGTSLKVNRHSDVNLLKDQIVISPNPSTYRVLQYTEAPGCLRSSEKITCHGPLNYRNTR